MCLANTGTLGLSLQEGWPSNGPVKVKMSRRRYRTGYCAQREHVYVVRSEQLHSPTAAALEVKEGNDLGRTRSTDNLGREVQACHHEKLSA